GQGGHGETSRISQRRKSVSVAMSAEHDHVEGYAVWAADGAELHRRSPKWRRTFWSGGPRGSKGANNLRDGCELRPEPEIIAHAPKRLERKERGIHRLGALTRLLRQGHLVLRPASFG